MRAHLLFFVILLVGGTVASAQSGGSEKSYAPSAPTITASPLALAIAGFDRDGDQVVSRLEYDDQVRLSFARGDRDGDGFIGLIEYSAWAEMALGNSNALPGPFNFDSNGDDKISQSEFVAEFSRRFAALDKNGDARLTRSELVTLVAIPSGDRHHRNGRGIRDESGGPLPPP